jgi:FtsP/CotA-like multicopper oxidase with cupredoxin domain
MTYSTAFALDLLLGLLLAAAGLGAAVALQRLPRRPGLVALCASAISLALLAGKLALALQLADNSFAFAERRLFIELPLLSLAVVAATALTLRPGAHSGQRAGLAHGAWMWSAMVAAGVTFDAILTRRLWVLALVPVVAALTAVSLTRDSAPLAAERAAGSRFGAPERVLAGLLALALAAAVGAAVTSRLPGRYDLGALATMDSGDRQDSSAHHAVPVAAEGAETTSVTELTGPQDRAPDVTYTLRAATLDVDGRQALAFNGQVPGPTLTAQPNQLIEVVLLNTDVEDGVSVHWHGYDVPNAEDGVAGVTQDTVKPGGTHTYRFLAEQVGTFWYHSHQASSEQVEKGLYGALVVAPAPPADSSAQAVPDEAVVVDHSWRGPQGFLAGDKEADAGTRVERREVAPGTPVRLRLINSRSNYNRYTLLGVPFRVTAVDGTDLNEPGEVTEQSLRLAAGGRYDLSFTMPTEPVTLTGLGDGYSIVFGDGEPARAPVSWPELDLARYGKPLRGAEPGGQVDREFTMDIDRRLGWLDGRPGYLWTVNGETYPKMPMYMVAEGDLVRVTILNRTLEDHPIHLHGHHMNVEEKNSRPITGSPWSSDTLNVAPGEQYVVTFRADNPGIWMDHCHDLDHAAQGFVMHVGYEGLTTPYRIGEDSGNQPE